MPLKPLYGDAIDLASVDIGKVAAVPASKGASPPIQADRWARCGKHPNAQLMNLMSEAANQGVLYRSKEVFSGADRIDPFHSISSVSTDRPRWRWAFCTGPYSHSLYAVVVMRPPNNGLDHNTYTRIDIEDSGGSIVATRDFIYGNDPTNGSGGNGAWPYYKVVTGFIEGVQPSTEYTGVATDIDYGRVLSCTIFDLPSLTENFNGYLPENVGTHSAIVSSYRENIATILYNLWRKGAAQVWNWSVNDQTSPRTTASSTPKNIIDTSVTTVSAASPGITLDMRKKARASQDTGVPVKMKAYLKMSATSLLTDAGVKLVDSAGATVLSISDLAGVTFSTSEAWYEATGVLPEAVDKYDLQFWSNGTETLSLGAVSIYEYE